VGRKEGGKEGRDGRTEGRKEGRREGTRRRKVKPLGEGAEFHATASAVS
jgi:hypothetical protein